MSTLAQANNSELKFIGWHGSCDSEPCQEILLRDVLDSSGANASHRIAIALQISGEGLSANKTFSTYNPDNSDPDSGIPGSNNFNKLECGHVYYIKLKKGSATTDTQQVVLPGFTPADSATTEEKLLTDVCGGTQPSSSPTKTETPSPSPTDTSSPTPSPTETPSPSPTETPSPTVTALECCELGMNSVSVVAGESLEFGSPTITASSFTQNATICVGTPNGELPYTLRLYSEGEVVGILTTTGTFDNSTVYYDVGGECIIGTIEDDVCILVDGPTPTPSKTPSPSPSPTETPSPTPSPSLTPTDTSSPTPSPTETQTPTLTETPTPSPSETPSPSLTPTDTSSPTPSPTETQTPTLTETPTPSPSETPSPSPSPTETQTPTVTEVCCEEGMLTQEIVTGVTKEFGTPTITASSFTEDATICVGNATGGLPFSVRLMKSGNVVGILTSVGAFDNSTIYYTDSSGVCISADIQDGECILVPSDASICLCEDMQTYEFVNTQNVELESGGVPTITLSSVADSAIGGTLCMGSALGGLPVTIRVSLQGTLMCLVTSTGSLSKTNINFSKAGTCFSGEIDGNNECNLIS